MRGMGWRLAPVAAAIVLGAPMAAVPQPASDGEAVFNARCKACHDPAQDRAPNRATLAAMKPADILEALNTGVMAPMAGGMSAADKQAVALYLTGGGPQARGRAPPAPAGVDPICAAHPPIRPSGSDWTQVGADAGSRRYQPNPGFDAKDVPRLKLKWAFAMPGGGMPTVVGDWLFVTNRNGKFYALDARTGCVHWAVEAASRTTPMVVRSDVAPSGWATFIGERNRTVRAFDAQTGKELWRSAPLSDVPAANMTGTAVVSGEQIFVPLSSGEEAAARQDSYPCCKFRGSLAALDLRTGKVQWQTYTVTEPMRPIRKNAAGVQQQGPAGGAIWSAPTADARRGLVYVATGDSYTDAPTKGADAIIAIEMKTGQVRWINQVTEHDNYIMGCPYPDQPANCPVNEGPDHDFGASPILFDLPGGRQILLAGQKSGVAYGMDPDTGKTLWSTRVGAGSHLGGIQWGMAADERRLFVPNADIVNLIDEVLRPKGQQIEVGPFAPARPGLSALDPATGEVLWFAPAPKAPCRYAGDRSRDMAKGACIRAASAAVSAMPGVVFSGTMDGWLRAYDARTGKILWAYSTTAQTYDTVNGVKAQPGGSLDGMGPAIAHGMVFTMSGFNGAANTGGNGVNVLLAFSIDGR